MQLCLELFEVSQDWLDNFIDNLNQNAIHFIEKDRYGKWIFKQKADNGLVRLKTIEISERTCFDTKEKFISTMIWRSGWSKTTPKFDKNTGYINSQGGSSGKVDNNWAKEVIEQINKSYVFDTKKQHIREEDEEDEEQE